MIRSLIFRMIIIAWHRIDCPDGKLTANSFRKIYTKCFPSGNVNEFCDHVFRTFDTDKNGFIDFKEFLLAIDVTSTGSPEEKLDWAFRLDQDARKGHENVTFTQINGKYLSKVITWLRNDSEYQFRSLNCKKTRLKERLFWEIGNLRSLQRI